MPDSKVIAVRIRNIREKLDVTQAQFADMLGVSSSAVAMYETGERIPRDEIKKKIAQLAGSKTDPIFFED